MAGIPLAVVEECKPNTAELLPMGDYDRCIVSYSGGKDSTALVAWALERFPRERIELWHQDVDGEAPLMDWPCTRGYVRAVAAALDLRVRFQWRIDGFLGEMTRKNRKTNPVRFELADGTIAQAGGTRGKDATRELFPQVSADLSVRWCSPYLKIDVAALAMNNDPDFRSGRFLFLTGERREESAARSRYAQTELHRCNSGRRLVHQHRAIIDQPESEVWEAMRSLRVIPHPCYRIGYPRLSCQHCIFQDPNQAATNRKISPAEFARLGAFERQWGKTIKRGVSLDQLADKGTPYPRSDDAELVKLALSHDYRESVLTDHWEMPDGAFKRGGGPT